MNTEIIVIGSSGHAKVIIDIFEKTGEHKIVGLIDSFRKKDEMTLGYKILGDLEDLQKIHQNNKEIKLFIAIGDNWLRQKMKNQISQLIPQASFASAIHPSSVISKHVKIGQGVAIMAGSVINNQSHISDFVIINTGSIVEHDCYLSEFSSLAPRVTLGGAVSIGKCSAISLGSTVLHKIKIGNHSLVGAGALLLSDCGDNHVMFGVPAKFIRGRENNEQYL